jgi:hypothetical protein
METNQKYINDYKNIISIDSNNNLNNNLNDNIDENNSSFKITQKNGEIEMIVNEPYIDYDNPKENENDNDNLSEFSQYRDHDFESDDDLECSLDSTLEFIFDFDIIYKPENSIEMFENIEIKSKIVNRIKLNALDLQNIKKLDDNEKFELIKLFNHMA